MERILFLIPKNICSVNCRWPKWTKLWKNQLREWLISITHVTLSSLDFIFYFTGFEENLFRSFRKFSFRQYFEKNIQWYHYSRGTIVFPWEKHYYWGINKEPRNHFHFIDNDFTLVCFISWAYVPGSWLD